MTEERFWALIDLIDREGRNDPYDSVQTLVNGLADFPVREIYSFDDLLAASLYALDTEAHARNMGAHAYKGADEHFSEDMFLYARCAIVAAGKNHFERVLAHPSEFPQDVDFEPLLYVAANAYQLRTGRSYEHETPISWETYSNKNGWAGQNIRPMGHGLGYIPPWMAREDLSQGSPEWEVGEEAAYMKKWKAWFFTLPETVRKLRMGLF